GGGGGGGGGGGSGGGGGDSGRRALSRNFGRAPLPAPLPIGKFARLGTPLLDRITHPFNPDANLRGCRPEHAARPDELERRELPPGLVAFDHSARKQIASHRRGVQTVAAESAGEPDARPELADLRHAMHCDSQAAGPSIVDLDVA